MAPANSIIDLGRLFYLLTKENIKDFVGELPENDIREFELCEVCEKYPMFGWCDDKKMCKDCIIKYHNK